MTNHQVAHVDTGHAPVEIRIICLPAFNALATMAFVDPFRAANYLAGRPLFRWTFLSGLPGSGPLNASNTAALHCDPISTQALANADWIVVSTSWTPEAYGDPGLLRQLKTAAARGIFVAGIDTGAFVLAEAGLLKRRRATVHYEHIDAFQEKYRDIDVVEDLFVLEADRATCCGGVAVLDLALQLLSRAAGAELANAAARYVFHDRLRPSETNQNPRAGEPMGYHAPRALRQAIQLMERHLETPISVPEIADKVGVSQRQLERLFRTHTRTSAVRYYVNARLDRARGLVTQTSLSITEVALASGFASPEHFSRVYRKRFGTSARQDRVNGRVPFEYRAWPMHSVLRDGES